MAAPVLEEVTGAAATAVSVMIASGRKDRQAAWRSMLAGQPGIAINGETGTDATGLAARVEHQLPNVLLLDKALLDALDPRSLQRIHAQCHHVRVLLLGEAPSPGLVADVLRHRFHGFLLTTSRPDTCVKAIRAVSQGELWLSRASLAMAIGDLLGLADAGLADAGHAVAGQADPALTDPGDAGASTAAHRVYSAEALTPRELQVVVLLRRGCINKEIARELGIMEDTVKKHLQSVFAKLGVRRRALVALRGLPPTA